ncbi:substrate-binding and VWA domain-containing protein [Virgisporangium ochraceum]|uniref:VWFA domain-containing protein n=1 Tax=Virgisporangium ochraceum TaxID=65505 RepID=A0A8J4EBH1_9ACTN|nr:substrate-binding domain-containing protein [Virgisporangium ochraceum]GIJ68589.1 hypothetical protein Voc01_035060 [Virgisporangium ochraceum]
MSESAAPTAPGPEPARSATLARRLNWRGRPVPPAVVWLSAALVLVLVAWASVTWINAALGAEKCDDPVVLEVAAAPAIAPALGELAGSGAAGSCAEVRVSARDSAGYAEILANPPPGTLPQVWVPESTFWLGRAQARGAFTLPASGTSIATTPVVVALTEPAARNLGWPQRPVPWSDLLGTQGATLPIGIPDPAADPVGVAGLVGVQAATAKRPDAGPAESLVLRRLTQYVVPRAADLYLKLPEAGGGAGSLPAFFTSEQALLRHNARGGAATSLVASYPGETVPTLDFPYVVLPGTQKAEVTAATTFLDRLLRPDARDQLQKAGFRDPDGTPPTTKDPSPSASRVSTEPIAPVAMPTEDELVQVLSRWTGVQLSARILAVIDVSGSMNERTPNGQTRLSLMMQAGQEGVGLLLDATELGIWVFSTRMEGDRDYQVLVPTGPLSDQRSRIIGTLGGIKAKSDGDTGLYDTTLAAYQEARRTWMPGRINIVLIATDGKNDDDNSIGRAQLIGELQKLADPRRPLPILFMGLGDGIDVNELNEISRAVDGRVYVAQQPGDIRAIFFSALSDFGCQPPSCRK